MSLAFIARALGCIVLSLLTLEFAARADDKWSSGADFFKPYTINTLFQPSPFGREGVPHARFAKWQMNGAGYRGPEAVAGRRNVLVFGASETFGLYESAGQEYPRQLEERLNRAHPEGYNVVNIALPGIRIGRLGYLKHAMAQTDAQYVVIYPSPANYIGTMAPFCGQSDVPTPSAMSWKDHVRLAGKLDLLVKKLAPESLMSALRQFSIWRSTRQQTVMERVPEPTIQAFKSDVACVVDAVRAQGAIPILVTHATYFGTRLEPSDTSMMLSWRRFYPELANEGFLDLEARANEALRQIALALHVPLADAARGIPKGPDYFADFVHFNDQGSARMAELIATVMEGARP